RSRLRAHAERTIPPHAPLRRLAHRSQTRLVHIRPTGSGATGRIEIYLPPRPLAIQSSRRCPSPINTVIPTVAQRSGGTCSCLSPSRRNIRGPNAVQISQLLLATKGT